MASSFREVFLRQLASRGHSFVQRSWYFSIMGRRFVREIADREMFASMARTVSVAGTTRQCEEDRE